MGDGFLMPCINYIGRRRYGFDSWVVCGLIVFLNNRKVLFLEIMAPRLSLCILVYISCLIVGSYYTLNSPPS